MSLRRLYFFTLLATIATFGTVGRLGPGVRAFALPRANMPAHGPELGACESPGHHAEPENNSGRSQCVNVFRAKGEMPQANILPIQSRNAEGLSAGKLLVASRDLADPNFAKTVILLVQYDAQGVVGLILNRRTKVPLSRVLEDLKAAKNLSDPVYLGGPVEMPSVFGLLKSPARIEGAERIFGTVYLISDKTVFERTIATRPDPGVFHVYLGYAGWTREQLRMEVELGAWFIFPGDAGTVFNADPDFLWPQMIRQTEMKLARNELPNKYRPARAEKIVGS